MSKELERARDGQLVQRGQQGDREALEALVRLYQGTLFKLAFRMLGNREDAADVTQTVFLKAFENLGSYNPEYKFFSWIYRIAINESLNTRRRDSGTEYLDQPVPDQGDGPELASRHDELKAQVQAALMQLSDSHRAVISLRHYAECSYAEMSTILELPEKTVRSRLFEARRSLQAVLQKAGVSSTR
jgi:RNA polymerase sigma-70 factor (ECF subfamily)